MSFCDCPEWEPNIVKVNAPLQLAFARNPVAANQYRGIPFRYCPWCGSQLKGFFEHTPSSGMETEVARIPALPISAEDEAIVDAVCNRAAHLADVPVKEMSAAPICPICGKSGPCIHDGNL
jgi:hypothetical protein